MRTKYIVLFFSSALLFGACSKSYLDLNSPSEQTTASYWKTAADLNAGVIGIYSFMVDDYNGHYGTVNWELTECRTENFVERNDVRDRYTISTFINTTSNSYSQG